MIDILLFSVLAVFIYACFNYYQQLVLDNGITFSQRDAYLFILIASAGKFAVATFFFIGAYRAAVYCIDNFISDSDEIIYTTKKDSKE